MSSHAASTVLTLLALSIAAFFSKAFGNMLRRLSTTFSRKKENGQANGSVSRSAEADGRRKSSHAVVNGTTKEEPDHSIDREQVSNIFKDFAQLVHASQRPLPTQSGDGSYLDHEVPSGMMADLRSMGFKDMKTLKDLIQTKASGALQDDKTYLMERVIQVRRIRDPISTLTDVVLAACQWFTGDLAEESRTYKRLHR